MSAAAAEPIRTAADLDLPANLASLGEGLPLETRAQLADALLKALDVARRTNDLGQLQRTVQRWQLIRKTMLRPGWSEVVAWVESGAGRHQAPMTFEEFEAEFRPKA
jgi:hypothetical protein